MTRRLSIFALLAAVVFTTIMAGCATTSSDTPKGLSGSEVKRVNDKGRPY
jgi:outer membrane murein-binding lipoprotein Lpp